MTQIQKRKIIFWPNPVLRTVALPVAVRNDLFDGGEIVLKDDVFVPSEVDWGFVLDSEISGLVDDMIRLMREDKGIGLAANQIAVPKRVIVMDIPCEHGGNGLVVMINPEITELSQEKAKDTEGCLSLPGQRVTVERPTKASVRYVSVRGKIFTMHLSGLAARCLQHENDHINGVVIIDHVDPVTRRMTEEKLKKELARR